MVGGSGQQGGNVNLWKGDVLMRKQQTYNMVEILRKLQEEDQKKKDMMIPASQIYVKNDLRVVHVDNQHKEGLRMSERAATQLLNRYGLPVRDCKELAAVNPSKLAWMLNNLLSEDSASLLMRLRIGYRGTVVRAFLTESYSILNNSRAVRTVLDSVDMSLQPKVTQFYNSEKMMHMRIVFDRTEIGLDKSMIKRGDTIKTGIDISNSEVGFKSLVIEPLVYRLVCDNGLRTWGVDGDIVRQRHSFVSDSELNDMVMIGVKKSTNKAFEVVKRLDESRKIKIINPIETIRKISEQQNVGKKFTEEIVRAYMQEPMNNRYGIVNAFTRASRVAAPEKRLEIETLAGRILSDDRILVA